MEKKTLHLLILEDSPDDAALAVRELEQAGFTLEWSRVETERAFREALEKTPDLILADYAVPSFNGMDALKMQQEIAQEIPLVIISGTIGEEHAVECMKLGALDYVLKDRLFRLGPVVKRALEQAEEHRKRERTEEALLATQQNFRNSLDSAPLGIRIVSAEGKLLYANQAILDIYGYSSIKELETVTTKKRYTPESYAEHQQRKEQRRLGKPTSPNYEISIVRKDGEIRHLVAARKEVLWNGEIQFQVIYQDITKRKRAEEALQKSEERYRSIYENSSDAIFMLDPDGMLLAGNPMLENISGYKIEELIGRNFFAFLVPEDRKRARSDFHKMLLGKASVKRYKMIHREEQNVIISANGAPLYTHDRLEGLVVIARDVTERQMLIEKLEESEERHRVLFKSSANSIALIDKEGRFLTANPAMEESLGVPLEELIGKTFFEVMPQDVAQRRLQIVIKALDERQSQTFEDEREGKHFHNIFVPMKIPGQEETVQIIASDITKRKRAEEALEEAQRYTRGLIESSLDALMTISADGKITDVNYAAESITGISRKELIGTDFSNYFTDSGAASKVYQQVFREGYVQDYPLEIKRRDGEVTPVFYNASAYKDVQGRVVGAFAAARDITERKKSEEQLERSFFDLAETVSRAMSSRDPYTASHQQRVAELAVLVGEKMELSKDRLQGLYIGGLLHDIGKISSPEVILTKPGMLTEEEWNLIRAHAKQGYDILKDTRLPWPVADIALHHHERLDGSGYPHGLSGDKLSLEIRILAVCDVVEAMSSHRPYRPARSKEAVLEEITGGRGTKYDAAVVDIMLQLIEDGEFELGWEFKN